MVSVTSLNVFLFQNTNDGITVLRIKNKLLFIYVFAYIFNIQSLIFSNVLRIYDDLTSMHKKQINTDRHLFNIYAVHDKLPIDYNETLYAEAVQY